MLIILFVYTDCDDDDDNREDVHMWLCCNSERKDEQINLCARCLIRASYKMSLGPANVLLNDDDLVVGYLLCNAHIRFATHAHRALNMNNLYYY
jgi:hypothetical protein